jgi:hypothetical protein
MDGDAHLLAPTDERQVLLERPRGREQEHLVHRHFHGDRGDVRVGADHLPPAHVLSHVVPGLRHEPADLEDGTEDVLQRRRQRDRLIPDAPDDHVMAVVPLLGVVGHELAGDQPRRHQARVGGRPDDADEAAVDVVALGDRHVAEQHQDAQGARHGGREGVHQHAPAPEAVVGVREPEERRPDQQHRREQPEVDVERPRRHPPEVVGPFPQPVAHEEGAGDHQEFQEEEGDDPDGVSAAVHHGRLTSPSGSRA